MVDKLEEYPLWAKAQPGAAVAPDRSRSYAVGPVKGPTYVNAPRSLPAMPPMLQPEPEEAALTGMALKSMMMTDYADDSLVKAKGAAVRVVIFAAVAFCSATILWTACFLFLDSVGWRWLIASWAGASILTGVYMIISEAQGRRFSAAGIEHAKIRAAVAIHADRLDSRERMHAQAAAAWERVLTTYLENGGR